MISINKLCIGDKEFSLIANVKAMFAYEKLTGKPFETPTYFEDRMKWLYCQSVSGGNTMTWDEFTEFINDKLDTFRYEEPITEPEGKKE